MAKRVPVIEIYWEEADADAEAESQNHQNESQNNEDQSQNESQNQIKNEEIQMKIYEDVGNRVEAQNCLEDKKEEKSE